MKNNFQFDLIKLVLGIYMIFHGIHYGFRPIISFAASSVLLGLSGYMVFIALAMVVFHW
jgi:hypothetical protein